MKITHKLILGFSVVTFLMLVFGYYAASISQRALETIIGEDAVSISTGLLNDIDRGINNKIDIFVEYSNDPALQDILARSNRVFDGLDDAGGFIDRKDIEWTSVPVEETTPFMQRLLNNELSKKIKGTLDFYERHYGYRVFGEVLVTNRYGALAALSGRTSAYRQDDAEWWRKAVKTGLYIRDVAFDESSGVNSTDVAIRVDDENGNFLGVMKVVLNVEDAIGVLRESTLGEKYKSMHYELLTYDGRIIYATERKPDLKDFSTDDFFAKLTGESGYFVMKESGNNEMVELMAYARSSGFKNFDGFGWILVIEYDAAEVFAPVIRIKRLIAMVLGIVTLVAVLMSWLSYRAISKPVERLRMAATGIGSGDFNARIDIDSKDEFGELASTFNQMAERLKEAITLRDVEIRERKSSEEALKTSETKYRLIHETVFDGIIIADTYRNIVECNGSAAEIFGYENDELVGMNLAELMPEEFTESHLAGVRRFIDGGDEEVHGQIVNKQGIRKNGELFPIEVVLKSFELNGKTFLTGTVRDITEHKVLEQQLLQSQKMEAIGQLTGGIAHDFNNMLQAIMMHTELLEMMFTKDDPIRGKVASVTGLARKAAGLTQRLLAFSRKQIINPRPVNLSEILENADDLLKRLIGAHISIETSSSKDKLTIMADSGQIEQVLMNLATNARDAMPDGGSLFIATEHVTLDDEFIRSYGYGEPGCYVCITVKDTGTGMDRMTQKKVFEPFFTTKDADKGTGLGLSVVYGILKQHNGYINVHSEPGVGTEFKIYLPLVESAVEEEDPLEPAPMAAGTETLLLAEDNAEIRKSTKEVLENFGYKVIEAMDGEDAINKFMENRASIQFLILDVMMPGRSGKEAYDEIKKASPEMKALFVSGYADDIISESCASEEKLHFISKPVTPTELLRKIKEILHK